MLSERELLIAPISDSPKPPSERITMTLPLLNKATWIAFVVTGNHGNLAFVVTGN